MGTTKPPTPEWFRTRKSVEHLELLQRNAIGDIKQGIANAEHYGYGDRPENNWRFVYGVDYLELVYTEIEMRRENMR